MHDDDSNPFRRTGMTQRTRAQQRADEIDISPTKLLADIEQLKAELGAANAKAD